MATASDLVTETPESVVTQYFEALNTGDVGSIRRLFTDDAVVMLPGFPTATGSHEIGRMFEGAFAATRLAMTPTIDAAEARGPLATVRSHASGTMTLTALGSTIPQENREVWILRNTGDRWRIAAYMFNTAAPEEAG